GSVPRRQKMRQDWFGWRSARRVGQLRLACSSPESVFATSLCQSVGRYPPPHGICWTRGFRGAQYADVVAVLFLRKDKNSMISQYIVKSHWLLRPGLGRKCDLHDLDVRGSRQFDHVFRSRSTGKRDDEVGGARRDHPLVATQAVFRVDPVPLREKIPFEDVVVPRPLARH